MYYKQVPTHATNEGECMEMEFHNTIRDADEGEWTSLVGTDHIERSHQWFRTIEDSGMTRMHYVFVRENGTLAAAACCHLFKENRFKIPLLDVSSPLGLSSAFFCKTPHATEMLMKGLEEIRRREKAKGISIFELRKEGFFVLKEQLKSYIGFSMLGNTYLDLNFGNFKEYLAFLPYKARRSVKNTLKRTEKLGVSTVSTNEFARWKDVTYRLQKALCDEHNDYTLLLNKQFYDALEKNMKDTAELLLFFKDDIPLVFALFLHSPHTTHYKFVGMDPEYREYQAYFLSYYEIIKESIKRNKKRIFFGITTYEFKEKIGCQVEELFGLAKMKNPLLNAGLKAYITIFKAFR
ncbi:MAG: GNAT family N-acetyltransferase [Theionarchaea archaeon]|nr:GNAT family N-acetyltransferase [Theionarchaea archaeon]